MNRLLAFLTCTTAMATLACSGQSPTGPSRMNESAVAIATAPSSLAAAGAASVPSGAALAGIWPPEQAMPGGPPLQCDPMTTSPTALAIADVKAEIAALTKELRKLQGQLGFQVLTELPKWEAELAKEFAALRAFDAAAAASTLLNPFPGTPAARAAIVARMDWAIRMIKITEDTIAELQRQIAEVWQSLQILGQLLRNLQAELSEFCHDQPAPPPLLH